MKNVLVVEDYTLAKMKHVLSNAGFSVFAANGIDMAQQHIIFPGNSIDAIICDLNMCFGFLADESTIRENIVLEGTPYADIEYIPESFRREASGSLLTGWVWLKYCVLARMGDAWAHKIAIRSAYIKKLSDELRYSRDGRQKLWFEQIHKINRDGDFDCSLSIKWLNSL